MLAQKSKSYRLSKTILKENLYCLVKEPSFTNYYYGVYNDSKGRNMMEEAKKADIRFLWKFNRTCITAWKRTNLAQD